MIYAIPYLIEFPPITMARASGDVAFCFFEELPGS
jgi:hypothetical protein